MVNVRQIAEMGAYVQLLEYDNIEGMILLSELSRRRIRSIQKLIRVGKNEVVVVLRVDKEKGKKRKKATPSKLMARRHISTKRLWTCTGAGRGAAGLLGPGANCTGQRSKCMGMHWIISKE